jgi:hypothetical protein
MSLRSRFLGRLRDRVTVDDLTLHCWPPNRFLASLVPPTADF